MNSIVVDKYLYIRIYLSLSLLISFLYMLSIWRSIHLIDISIVILIEIIAKFYNYTFIDMYRYHQLLPTFKIHSSIHEAHKFHFIIFRKVNIYAKFGLSTDSGGCYISNAFRFLRFLLHHVGTHLFVCKYTF